MGGAVAQLAPHFPCDPEQEDAAGKQEAHDQEQLCRDEREDDAQDRGGEDADQDGLAALVRGQAGRGHADDDRIVTGQNEINRDHGEERLNHFGRQEIERHGGKVFRAG